MTEDKKVIVFKNRIEVKILLIAYALVFIPLLVWLVISLIKSFDYNLFIFLLIPIFSFFVLYIINRFNITFDYQKEEIRFTNYFTKTRTLPFKDIKIICVKSKTTIPYDFDYNFYLNDKKVFKISSIDFEGQTKESIDYLNQLFSDDQKSIMSLENLSLNGTGYIEFYAFSLQDYIAQIVLDNDYFIIIKYDSNCSCFKLIVSDIEEKIVKDHFNLFNEVQLLINKYQEYKDIIH